MNRTGKAYDDMTPEELRREFREAFFETDIIDDALNHELDQMLAALQRKQPVENLFTPEESWKRYLEDKAEDLRPFLQPGKADEPHSEDGRYDPEKARQRSPTEREGERTEFFDSDEAEPERPKAGRHHVRSVSSLLRKVLIAAVIVVLLAGAAFAANYTGLWAWVPRWNASSGRYEPTVQEGMPERPIPAALAELGITEPVYPAKLPEGFVITESHISEDPLVLMEQYARGRDRLSITVVPVKSVKSAVYQKNGVAVRELQGGLKAHFVFENEETITAIWFTKNYAAYISGDLSVEEITEIILSIDSTAEGGDLS